MDDHWSGIPGDCGDERSTDLQPPPIVSHQIRSGTIRGGKRHFRLGDPYEWSIDYEYDPTRPGERVAVCKGATPENTAHRREIAVALKALGFEAWGWVKADKKKVLRYREWRL